MGRLIIGILIAVLSSGVCSAEQKRIMAILSSDIQPYRETLAGFKAFFAHQGDEVAFSEFNLKDGREDALLSALDKGKPAGIIAVGTKAATWSKENVKTIPVICCLVMNPDEFNAPNVAGITINVPLEKKLAAFRSMFPRFRKMGIIYSESGIQGAEDFAAIQNAGGQGNLQILRKKVASAKEFPEALNELSWKVDSYLMVPDTRLFFPESVKYLLVESMNKGFPVIGLSSYYTNAGALISFECDNQDIGMQAGEMAARVLRGERPGTIGFQQPRKMRYSLNLLTARNLGIDITPQIIKNAFAVVGE